MKITSINDYFKKIESLAVKVEKLSAEKKAFEDSRRPFSLVEATRLKDTCDKYFLFEKTNKSKREMFVFIFVVAYSVAYNDHLAHSIRFLLSLILEVEGPVISRSWRNARERYKEDKTFRENTNEVYDALMRNRI